MLLYQNLVSQFSCFTFEKNEIKMLNFILFYFIIIIIFFLKIANK
jgi:hypothetical protein